MYTIARLDTARVHSLHAGGEKLLVGQRTLRKARDGEALLIATADDPQDEAILTHHVTFESARRIRAVGYAGSVPVVAHGSNTYSLMLNTCDAVLLIAESPHSFQKGKAALRPPAKRGFSF